MSVFSRHHRGRLRLRSSFGSGRTPLGSYVGLLLFFVYPLATIRFPVRQWHFRGFSLPVRDIPKPKVTFLSNFPDTGRVQDCHGVERGRVGVLYELSSTRYYDDDHGERLISGRVGVGVSDTVFFFRLESLFFLFFFFFRKRRLAPRISRPVGHPNNNFRVKQ